MKKIKSAFLSLTIFIVIMLECVMPVSASEQDIQSFTFDSGETVITFDVSGEYVGEVEHLGRCELNTFDAEN